MSPINNTNESVQIPTNVGNLGHFEQYDIAGDDSDRIDIDDRSMSPASPAQAAVSPAQAAELDRSRSRSFNRGKAGSRHISPSVKERIKKWDNHDGQDAADSFNDNNAKKSHGDGGVPILPIPSDQQSESSRDISRSRSDYSIRRRHPDMNRSKDASDTKSPMTLNP